MPTMTTVGDDGDAASPSRRSVVVVDGGGGDVVVVRRHHGGLSPRQRRLLQASARARASVAAALAASASSSSASVASSPSASTLKTRTTTTTRASSPILSSASDDKNDDPDSTSSCPPNVPVTGGGGGGSGGMKKSNIDVGIGGSCVRGATAVVIASESMTSSSSSSIVATASAIGNDGRGGGGGKEDGDVTAGSYGRKTTPPPPIARTAKMTTKANQWRRPNHHPRDQEDDDDVLSSALNGMTIETDILSSAVNGMTIETTGGGSGNDVGGRKIAARTEAAVTTAGTAGGALEGGGAKSVSDRIRALNDGSVGKLNNSNAGSVGMRGRTIASSGVRKNVGGGGGDGDGDGDGVAGVNPPITTIWDYRTRGRPVPRVDVGEASVRDGDGRGGGRIDGEGVADGIMTKTSSTTTTTTTASTGPIHERPSTGGGGCRDDDGRAPPYDDSRMRYYRITFRGVVSLMPDIDDARRDRELRPPAPPRPRRIDSSHERTIDRTTTKATADEHDVSVDVARVGDGTNGGTYYVGHGEIVMTCSPEIVIPRTSTASARVIRVDSILTGGYAADAGAAPRSYDTKCDHPPRVGVSHEVVRVGRSVVDGGADVDESREGRERHYGYLLLSDPRSCDRSIAKPLSTAASASIRSSCECGSFLYRVISRVPVSILSGPSVDAVGLGIGLLPGTVHEVSLRISVPMLPPSDHDDDNHRVSETLVDVADAGEVRFLRLSQRRGWVADRVIIATDNKLRVTHHMQDVTNDEESKGRLNLTLNKHSGGASTGGAGLIDASLSMSFEDASSIHSSALNSVSNSSFYSSVLASSVATPTAVKLQRRRNRRRTRADRCMDRTQPPVLPSLAQEKHRIGESFEDTSSITCGDTSISGEGDHSSLVSGHQRPNETFYLMRVMAPLGLKILDAPHFQVTNLIHNPSPRKTNVRSSSSISPGTSPFARTNAMIGSSSREDSPTATVRRKGNRTGVRFLAKGQIFEASSRIEMSSDSSPYINGQGLLKLCDGSGWAIVPYKQDLVAQLHSHHGSAAAWSDNSKDIIAYEEIGNAVIPAARVVGQSLLSMHTERTLSNRSPDGLIWLRVASPPNGVKVLLPPAQHKLISNQQNNEKERAKTRDESPPTSHDSEVAASVISSSFLESVWSKVSPMKGNESNTHFQLSAPSQNLWQQQRTQNQHAVPIIPCGMVVPVESWEVSTNSKKHFARLYNGQGWIPLRLGEETYSHEVDPPDVRVGSFWFRVSLRTGLDVRHGPSSNASVIISQDGATFRFECGEFLRASEVITVFYKPKPDECASATSTECFAKLYRRTNNINGINSSQTLLARFFLLRSFVSPGEWVQVHGHGELFLEECSTAPTIERNRDGWQYTVIRGNDSDLHIRSGPSLNAKILGKLKCTGTVFLVTEKVTANGDQSDWLRLKNGGWFCSVGYDGKAVVQAVSMPCIGPNSSKDVHSQRMVRQILDKGRMTQ